MLLYTIIEKTNAVGKYCVTVLLSGTKTQLLLQ